MVLCKFKFALMAGVFAVVALNFVTANAQTINDTLSNVYENNPQLDAERAKLRSIDEGVAQSWSAMRPNVSVSISKGVDHLETSPGSGKRYLGTPASLGLSASQTLFNGFQTLNNARAAQARVQGGQASLMDIEQNLLLNSITAHANVVRDREIVQLRKNAVSIYRLLNDAAVMRHKIGEISITDVSITSGRLELGLAELALAESTLAQTEADYKKYTGHNPKKLANVMPATQYRPKSLEEAVAIAIANNPALRNAQAGSEEARYSKYAAIGALSPTVSAVGTLSDDRKPVQNVDSRESAGGYLKVNVPIFDGGLSHSRVRQAKSVEQQREFEAMNVQQIITSGVQGTWFQSQQSETRMKALARQVVASEKAFEGVKAEYRVGERSIYDILLSQKDVIDSKIALAESKKDRAVTSYALLAVIGKLNSQSLGLNVEQYDAKVHSEASQAQWFGFDTPVSKPEKRNSVIEYTGSVPEKKSTNKEAPLNLNLYPKLGQ